MLAKRGVEHTLKKWSATADYLSAALPDHHFEIVPLGFEDIHDAVVHTVRNGDVDGGTVRSDTLERMAAAGSINIDDFLVLNEQQSENFPFKLSTSLYPEWPFATVKTTSVDLSRKVASALLAMDEDELAAKSSKSAGVHHPVAKNADGTAQVLLLFQR